ncbi:MAG TPA: DUF3301 domain-containing protein [Steroidobacteraceae bacterium]|jgi:hypothetical protein
MELGWTALAFIIITAAVAWFWQDSLAARERANSAAIEACERLSLQFLDGTVAFARIVLTRGAGGSIALRRTYVFDYTANSIERRQGFVLLTGQRVESVGYAAGETQPRVRIAAQTFTPTTHEHTPDRGNVLNLEDWRARQRTTHHGGQSTHQDHGHHQSQAQNQNPSQNPSHDQGSHPTSAPASWRDHPPAERPSDHSDRKH